MRWIRTKVPILSLNKTIHIVSQGVRCSEWSPPTKRSSCSYAQCTNWICLFTLTYNSHTKEFIDNFPIYNCLNLQTLWPKPKSRPKGLRPSALIQQFRKLCLLEVMIVLFAWNFVKSWILAYKEISRFFQ